jgi:hypothetical protein
MDYFSDAFSCSTARIEQVCTMISLLTSIISVSFLAQIIFKLLSTLHGLLCHLHWILLALPVVFGQGQFFAGPDIRDIPLLSPDFGLSIPPVFEFSTNSELECTVLPVPAVVRRRTSYTFCLSSPLRFVPFSFYYYCIILVVLSVAP